MYDYLIVGAGLYGSVFAQQMTERGKRCLILEKRGHIGGNCYTRVQDDIVVHEYGPHIFHTNNDAVWNYVNRFAKFNHFTNRVKVNHKGSIYSFPINLMTLYQVWGVTTPAEAEQKLAEVRIPIKEPKNLEEHCLSMIGEELYQKFIFGYTYKQWLTHPKTLSADIIKRLPIRLTFDDNYYFDKYQGIPIGGYTPMIEAMLDGVEVKLEANWQWERTTDGYLCNGVWRKLAKKLVFTGPVDMYFGRRWGPLDYRTLEFDHISMPIKDFQGNAQVNYTDRDVAYTRVVEHKHFEFGQQPTTIVTYERPVPWESDKMEMAGKQEPYYPVNDYTNRTRMDYYRKCIEEEKDVIFGGRLATYQYVDMHQVIASAIHKAKEISDG